MLITDWFDVKNVEHLKAYRHLEETGMWEKSFIPKEIEFPSMWQISIMHKMVDAYMEKMGV